MNIENTAALLAAIQNGKPWIDRFTRKGYSKAFEEYRERFGPAYREAASAEEELPALAEALLDGLAAGWARQKPWNRSVARVNDKQVIVCYLTPMLLEEGPLCASLAEKLREAWAARWPKEAYMAASAARFQKGFRPSIFGIPLPVRGGEEDDG